MVRVMLVPAAAWLAVVLSAVAPAPAGATSHQTGATRTQGRVVDASGDAGAGADLGEVRASNDGRGTLIVTVVMHGGPLRRENIVLVRFGRLGTGRTCSTASGEQVEIAGGSQGAFWSSLNGDAPVAGPAVTRMTPTSQTRISSGITRTDIRSRTLDCATALVLTSRAGPNAPVDTTPVLVLEPTRDAVPTPVRGAPSVLQLNHTYDQGVRVRRSRASVSVMCVASASRACAASVVLREQRTHTLLGSARRAIPLGTARSIAVPLHLTRAMKRRSQIYAVVTVRAPGGPTALSVLILLRG